MYTIGRADKKSVIVPSLILLIALTASATILIINFGSYSVPSGPYTTSQSLKFTIFISFTSTASEILLCRLPSIPKVNLCPAINLFINFIVRNEQLQYS